MIGSIIALAFLCVLLGVILWAGQRLLALVPLAEPFATIVHILVDILLVLIMVIIVLYVLVQLLALAGIQVPYAGILK